MRLNNIISSFKSPNFGERPEGFVITEIVLHNTVTKTISPVLNYFLKPDGASSHYLIDVNGDIYSIVDEEKRAWHAGRGQWKNHQDINSTSIGIEIVNPGDTPFSEEQIESVGQLIKYLMEKYSILPENIIAHGDMAPERKQDPSGFFPWVQLYKKLNLMEGVIDTTASPSLNEVLIDHTSNAEDIKRLKIDLFNLGYTKVNPEDDKYDINLRSAVTAFNRHFSPNTFEKESINPLNQVVILKPSNEKWYKESEKACKKLGEINRR